MKNTKLVPGASRSLGLLRMAHSGHGSCGLKYTAGEVFKYLKYGQFEVTYGNVGYYVKETEIKTKKTRQTPQNCSNALSTSTYV